MHTHFADLLCILYCLWSAALFHCPLQRILSFFACHAGSPLLLTFRALPLSHFNNPIHLSFSALYRFNSCRGFPYVSELQLQFLFSFILSSAFACCHSPWFSELTLCMPPLRMPHHATLCSSCLNCQSNFRLKVFLLFLTPTAVSFFVYSFFCFCVPIFSLIFWTGSLLCLLYACHLM